MHIGTALCASLCAGRAMAMPPMRAVAPPTSLPARVPGTRLAASSRPARSGIFLGALALVYVTNQWARALPSSLVRFGDVPGADAFRLMNVDLGMDESQYGLLISYGFTILYTVASLLAGVLCDRFSRGKLLVAATLGWSAATALQGGARTFAHVLGARAVLGISQARWGDVAEIAPASGQRSPIFSPCARAGLLFACRLPDDR